MAWELSRSISPCEYSMASGSGNNTEQALTVAYWTKSTPIDKSLHPLTMRMRILHQPPIDLTCQLLFREVTDHQKGTTGLSGKGIEPRLMPQLPKTKKSWKDYPENLRLAGFKRPGTHIASPWKSINQSKDTDGGKTARSLGFSSSKEPVTKPKPQYRTRYKTIA